MTVSGSCYRIVDRRQDGRLFLWLESRARRWRRHAAHVGTIGGRRGVDVGRGGPPQLRPRLPLPAPRAGRRRHVPRHRDGDGATACADVTAPGARVTDRCRRGERVAGAGHVRRARRAGALRARGGARPRRAPHHARRASDARDVADTAGRVRAADASRHDCGGRRGDVVLRRRREPARGACAVRAAAARRLDRRLVVGMATGDGDAPPPAAAVERVADVGRRPLVRRLLVRRRLVRRAAPPVAVRVN